MLAAGADGCPTGWICVTRDQASGEIGATRFDDAASLIHQQPRPDTLAIDVPIGLPQTGSRECDLLARQRLGPRGRSVFPAPIRPLLRAYTWEEACALRERIDGKRVSKQVWEIVPKIRDIDAVLRALPPGERGLVREVHPELCFRECAGHAMTSAKKSPAGRAERHSVVIRRFGKRAFDQVRTRYPRQDVADDDILDAFAALWTAERILAREAFTIPAKPPLDDERLPMEIVV